jgi:protoheme ferro-lyase
MQRAKTMMKLEHETLEEKYLRVTAEVKRISCINNNEELVHALRQLAHEICMEE